MKDAFKELLEELQDELKQAHFARVNQLEKNRKQIARLRASHVAQEPFVRQRIDAACGHWIENGFWKREHMVDAPHIWDRLNAGFLYGELLRSSGFHVPAENRNRILRFLLILQWDIRRHFEGAPRIVGG